MKMYVICDNNDTLTGLGLAGVEGVLVHEESDVVAEIKRVSETKDISVVLITSLLKRKCAAFLAEFMQKHPEPLFLEIPDRHSAGHDGDSISEFIEKSIGLKISEQ